MMTIAHYRIASKLGEGGMGAVYRAHDTKLGRDVAIKVLPPALANDADYITRFQREAQLLASLNHPNIAAIYGLEDNAIVMELVEGAELKGPLPLEKVVAIAKQIADALEAAHERGIIHRDLKPANIKIAPDGTVKILDFGLAKATGPARSASDSAANSPTLTIHATTAGLILGTAAYMSPEQAKGTPVDRRADIWAFGAVLWEMITGRQLFAGETVSETLAAVLRDEVDFAAVPPGPVRTLITRCLERDPRKRLGWIGEARTILDTPVAARAMRRNWLPWVIAACAIAGAAVMSLRKPTTGAAPFTTFSFHASEKTHFHSASASPDGRRIAVEVDDGGGDETTYLAIRSMDSLELVRLPGTEVGYNPFWSPDGRSVAFFARGKLRKLHLNGTAPVVICDLPAPEMRHRGFWSSTGTILLSGARSTTRVLAGGPWVVSAAGGTPKPLPLQTGEMARVGAQLLPDGRQYLYTTPREHAIHLGYLDKPDSERIIEAAELIGFASAAPGSMRGHLLFARNQRGFAQELDVPTRRVSGDPVAIIDNPDLRSLATDSGDVIAYHSVADTSVRLQWMTLEGAAIPFHESGAYTSIALSPDGKRIAATVRTESTYDIWVIDPERRGRTRLSSSPGSKRSPLWSPDGSRIVYVAYDGKAERLYSQSVNGGTPATLLLESAQSITPNSFSPDGRVLVYSMHNAKNSGRDLWFLRPGDKPQPYLVTEFPENHGQFSPDGRFLAYASMESGQPEIYVRPFPDATAGKWQVSTRQGSQPRWSPDGAKLYYLDGGRRLNVCNVRTLPSFESRSCTVLFPVMVPASYTGGPFLDSYYSLAPDGKRIAAMVLEGESSIVVLQNWRTLLRPRP